MNSAIASGVLKSSSFSRLSSSTTTMRSPRATAAMASSTDRRAPQRRRHGQHRQGPHVRAVRGQDGRHAGLARRGEHTPEVLVVHPRPLGIELQLVVRVDAGHGPLDVHAQRREALDLTGLLVRRRMDSMPTSTRMGGTKSYWRA